MLILNRRPGESIAIGEQILVTVVEVSGDRVKIGIEAPQRIVILRQELCEAVIEENRAAQETRREEIREAVDSLRQWLGTKEPA